MRERLAELSKISARLRAGIQKKSSLAGAALKGATKLIMKRPIQAAAGGAGLGLGALGAVGKKRQYQAGFDPEVQKAMLGPTPTPPGTT